MKWKSLLLLIACLLCVFCHEQKQDNMIYMITEVPPTFKYKNCVTTYESCKKYFKDNFKMPEKLLSFEYMGTIYIQLVIEKDSSISHVKISRGIDNILDTLVLETVRTMPKWIPGKIKGKIVRTYYSIPISIRWLYGNVEE